MSRLLRVSSVWYGRLLRLYPAEHRRSHGAEMTQLFRDQCRDAWESRRGIGIAKLWVDVLGDTVVAALREWMDKMGAPNPGLVAAALVGAALVGWIDFTATEMQSILAVLLLTSALLGVIQPSGAWRWGILVAAGVPVTEALALLLGVEPAGFAHTRAVHPGVTYAFGYSNVLESLIVVVPALLAAYAGAALRLALRSTIGKGGALLVSGLLAHSDASAQVRPELHPPTDAVVRWPGRQVVDPARKYG